MSILTYKYYDTPEGEDCFPKMFYMSKYAAYFGLGAAVTDILLLSHPKGYLQTAGRFVYYMGPMTAMAAAFAGTVCIATSVREKDDRLNYVLGALSSASIYGAARKSVNAGLGAAVTLGLIAYIKKWNNELGRKVSNMQPVTKVRLFGPQTHDFSGLKGKY